MLLLGQLYTNAINNDTNDDDANDDNDTRQTNYDCIGSLVCMPNEPKSKIFVSYRLFMRARFDAKQ